MPKTLLRPFALASVAFVAAACSSASSPSDAPDAGPGSDAMTADGGDAAPPPSCSSTVAQRPGTVVTDRGAVTGAKEGNTYVYRDIPFAAPPVGALRWMPPQPAACWDGERDATAWGPSCPQSDAAGTGPVVGDEDCLQVNVWTPVAAGAPRAVMVFVHGGGFVGGSASEQAQGIYPYDAQAIADRGDVVVVTLNYRLGALGFLALPQIGKTGNLGLLDQIAALQWVQRNAAAFGGDPTKVTVFGESAGGASVCALVAAPPAKGLFRAAIIESGGCPAKQESDAEAFATKVIQGAKCDTAADVPACMRALTAQQVVSAYPVAVDIAGPGNGYSPVIDGATLTAAPFDVITAGMHNAGALIVGTNAMETSRSVPLKMNATDAEYQAAVQKLLPSQADAILQHYPSSQYASPWAAYVALTSDAKFICGARKIARAALKGQSAPIYRYVFSHALDNSPALKPFGAWHGAELLYLFGHLDVANYSPSAAEVALSGEMIDAWTSFAKTGAPSTTPAWPKYDATDPYLQFDSTLTTGAGVRTAQCDFWDSL